MSQVTVDAILKKLKGKLDNQLLLQLHFVILSHCSSESGAQSGNFQGKVGFFDEHFICNTQTKGHKRKNAGVFSLRLSHGGTQSGHFFTKIGHFFLNFQIRAGEACNPFPSGRNVPVFLVTKINKLDLATKVLETEHSSFFAKNMHLPNDRFCKYSKTVFSAYFPCNQIYRTTSTKCHRFLLRILLAIEKRCPRNHISPTYINFKPKSPKTARTRNDTFL